MMRGGGEMPHPLIAETVKRWRRMGSPGSSHRYLVAADVSRVSGSKPVIGGCWGRVLLI
jgi:hypothetical protein